MVTPETVRKLALAFDTATEQPHFENTSFRVGKKIFATMNIKENRICVKLSPIDQSVFCQFDATVVYPVPNAWGKQGWTLVNLKKVKLSMIKDLLNTAFVNVAPKKIGDKYRMD